VNGVRIPHGRGVAAIVSAAAVAAGLALTPAGPAALAALAAARSVPHVPVPHVPPAGSVPPDQDPFYRAPANIGSYAPGQIVATRPVTGSGISGVDAWQISYRTDDAHNRPEMTVTTLLVPLARWTGGGARPVVSLQFPEDSTGIQCAPSYQIASRGSLGVAFVGLMANPLLARNWAVAAPDFEGPKSEFIVGPQAGHAVLDGIRAVRNFRAGGIRRASRWALYGYSGGANATGWAAQMQPSYAPDVRLAGAAMGGTPADPKAVARYIDGGLFAGFEAAATASIITEYPQETDYQAIINAQGQADLQAAEGKCVDQLLTGFAFHKLASDSTIPDPLDFPPVAAVLATDTLGWAVPDTPVYDYHADTDEIVPVAQDDALTRAWCAHGATVQVVRDLIGEHAEEAVARQSSVLTFLASRFAGTPATNTC
jgi:Secretory lipase